jgi:hypothetical protein
MPNPVTAGGPCVCSRSPILEIGGILYFRLSIEGDDRVPLSSSDDSISSLMSGMEENSVSVSLISSLLPLE